MTPLLFMLCMSLSVGDGGDSEDCSFTWEIVDIADPNYAGFFDGNNKTIVGEDIKDLIHEAKHVKCYLESSSESDADQCYHVTDLEDIIKQVHKPERDCNWCQSYVKPNSDIWRYM